MNKYFSYLLGKEVSVQYAHGKFSLSVLGDNSDYPRGLPVARVKRVSARYTILCFSEPTIIDSITFRKDVYVHNSSISLISLDEYVEYTDIDSLDDANYREDELTEDLEEDEDYSYDDANRWTVEDWADFYGYDGPLYDSSGRPLDQSDIAEATGN